MTEYKSSFCTHYRINIIGVDNLAGIDKEMFGQRLREIRKKHGMTQAELGEKTGLADKYISRIETGKADVSLDCFVKLVNAFDVPADYYLQDSISYDYKVEGGELEKYVSFQRFGTAKTEQLLAVLDKLIMLMDITK